MLGNLEDHIYIDPTHHEGHQSHPRTRAALRYKFFLRVDDAKSRGNVLSNTRSDFKQNAVETVNCEPAIGLLTPETARTGRLGGKDT